jgi:cytochrome c556
MCHRTLILLLTGATLALAACTPRSSGGTTQQKQSPPQHPRVTIQDLMNGIIDPSADVLWDSVAYIASEKGIEDRQPRTAAEWQTVRRSAITLIEAANLLSMPGRSVAPTQGPGGLTPAEIQQRIDSSHAAFAQFARNLQDAGLQALAAIDAHNAEGLMDAGGRIDAACEACHVTYWYPNERRPDQ